MEIYYDKKSKEFVTLNKDNYLNIKDVKFYQTYSYNYHHYNLYKETDLEKASESEIKLLDNLNLEVRKENDNFYKFKEKGPKGGYCDYNFRPFSFEVTITNNNILEIKMFVKNKYVGIGLGAWCFFLTAFACITGMYTPGSPFQTTMNVITPIILISLGLIMPLLAKKNNSK